MSGVTWEKISREDTVTINGRKAAHCMFWARTTSKTVHDVPVKALVMLQLRFDGLIGFPGGLVDPGEDIETGLNRELVEEIGLDAGLSRLASCACVHCILILNSENNDISRRLVFFRDTQDRGHARPVHLRSGQTCVSFLYKGAERKRLYRTGKTAARRRGMGPRGKFTFT